MLRDGDEDDGISQYFKSIEQELMMETSNLVSTIFFCLAAHYIFNLTYHRKTGNVWVFIQEKIVGLPSKPGRKRSPSSLAHFSGIQRVYDLQSSQN